MHRFVVCQQIQVREFGTSDKIRGCIHYLFNYYDIPPYIVAAKEPISYYGVNAVGLTHEGFAEKVIKHISHAYRIIYQGHCSIFDAILMIKDQVPMSPEIQHIIDFVNATKLGIIRD